MGSRPPSLRPTTVQPSSRSVQHEKQASGSSFCDRLLEPIKREASESGPSPTRVQPDGSHPTKPKQKQVPSRPGAMPQHPPSRPSRVFDGSDAPRPAATRGCRHHSQRGRFVKVSCMKKDSTNPGMAAALRTCPVTPCPVQSDRVRAQSNRASCIVNPDKNAVSRHNDQAALPRMTITTVGRCYKRKPIKKRPCKLSDNSLHGLFLLKQTKRGLVVNLMGPHGLKPIESAINPIRTLRQGTSQEGA